MQALTRLERDAARWTEDLDYRIVNATTAARTREAGRSAPLHLREAVEYGALRGGGTTVIDGQKIVRPFSVTAGRSGRPSSSCWRGSG